MVNADDDSEYIQINDFYTYNAYKWWQLYGLSANTSTSYTNTLNSISQSTETGTFTFSGNFSGSFDASVSLTYTGTIQTGSEGNTFWSSTTESGMMYDDSFHGIEMTITPSANGATNDYNATYACVYNTQSTSTAATMTCTPNYSTNSQPLTLPEQTITIDEIRFNTAGSIQTNLFLSLLNQGTEVGSLNGSLGMSGGGTGSLTMTENGTTTTTTVNTNSLAYTLPVMNGTLDNSWQKYAMRDDLPILFKAFITYKTNPITFIWLGHDRYGHTLFRDAKAYGCQASNYQTEYDMQIVTNRGRNVGGYFLYVFQFYSNKVESSSGLDKWIHLNLSNQYYQNGLEIIPLFIGYDNMIPDDLYRYAFGSDRTIQAIDAQTAADQQHHDEMMDTSDSSQISTDGNALVDDRQRFVHQ